jgi:hypothetical protein
MGRLWLLLSADSTTTAGETSRAHHIDSQQSQLVNDSEAERVIHASMHVPRLGSSVVLVVAKAARKAVH